MSDVQDRITALEGKGWSLAAIARAMGVTYSAVQKWKARVRCPNHEQLVIQALDSLLKQKRIPKKRRSKTAGQ